MVSFFIMIYFVSMVVICRYLDIWDSIVGGKFLNIMIYIDILIVEYIKDIL